MSHHPTQNTDATRNLNPTPFGKSVLLLLTGRIAGQVLAFVTAPILTRLYSPEDFGVLQVFGSGAIVLTVIAGLRYEMAIPLGHKEEASNALVLSLLFSTLFSTAVLLTVSGFKAHLTSWFKAPELLPFLWLLSPAILLGAWGIAFQYLASREGRFGVMAWQGFLSALFFALASLTWVVVTDASAKGLFAGYFASQIVSLLLFIILFARYLHKVLKQISVHQLFAMAKMHRNFPLFDTWFALINALSIQMVPLILTRFFPVSVVGQYALFYRMVHLPMSLLSFSIAQVFFPLAAGQQTSTGDLSRLISLTSKRLIQIAAFPVGVLAVSGARLFPFVFGSQWHQAGVFSQILSVALLLQFVAAPLSMSLLVLHHQKLRLVWGLIFIISQAIALSVGSNGGVILALTIYTVVSCLGYACLLGVLYRVAQVSIPRMIRIWSKTVALSVISLLPCLIVELCDYGFVIWLTALFLALCIYILFLIATDGECRDFLITKWQALKRKTR